MAYVSEWERLDEAANRVIAIGVSKNDAQTDVCRAIADGALRIRAKPRKHTTRPVRASDQVLAPTDFDTPTVIKPEDLDWENSRPVKPWFVRHGASVPWGYWELDWIELFSADVSDRLLAGAKTEGLSAPPASSKGSAKMRTRPALERARRAIMDCYPEGVPPIKRHCRMRVCAGK